MSDHDDYLWDPNTGTPDDDVVRLEKLLRPYAQADDVPVPTATTRPRPWGWIAATVLAAAAAVVLAIWMPWQTDRTEAGPGWTVRVNGTDAGRLAVGDWLDTEGTEWTQLEVPEIGRVEVAPKSQLRLLRTSGAEHRLHLAQGTVRAEIHAPPRLFFVETPAAVAVDLGCAYELHVDENGQGRLRVDAGWVALERPGSVVRVPAGFSCALRSGEGLGVPVYDAANKAHRDALARWEGGAGEALADVLRTATDGEAITLFYLIRLVPASQREALVDRLQSLAPLPTGVTRVGLLTLREEELERYWDETISDMW